MPFADPPPRPFYHDWSRGVLPGTAIIRQHDGFYITPVEMPARPDGLVTPVSLSITDWSGPLTLEEAQERIKDRVQRHTP